MSSDLSVANFLKKKHSLNFKKRNIHVIVSGYKRNKDGVAFAVNGKDMLTGKNVTIQLATAEQYARLYTSPKDDWSIRLENAEKAITRRPSIAEFASARGSRSVPENGILTFSDIQQEEDGTIIGRWPNVVINNPEYEAAVACDYQVRVGISGKGTENQKKVPYILAMFSREAVSSNDITREKLDKMFSGTFLDTKSDLRTNVTTVVGFKDGTKGAFTLFPPKIKQENDEKNPFRSPRNLDEVFSNITFTKSTSPSLIAAAVVIAAKADIDFEQLKIKTDADEKYKQLYESVKKGDVKVAFVPGASFHISKYTQQAILGLKVDNDGTPRTANTNESKINGAGYVTGILGVRYISSETERVVPAFVKSLYTDNRVPDQKSHFFVKLEASDVGENIFNKMYGDDSNLKQITSHEIVDDNDEIVDDNDDDYEIDSDEAPSF